MIISDKYIEYNLINNIPILYPHNNKSIFYCPRYTIADANKLLHCFDKGKSYIKSLDLHYIKITLNKEFKTLDNVKALYYYVVVDNKDDFNLDFSNTENISKWLKNNVNNHYVIISTPVLQYENEYYNVANDNAMNIVKHIPNEVDNDEIMISKLLDQNCFTICDNYNIIISLYHKHIINKSKFINLTLLLNQLKHFYYTPQFWLKTIHHHRILNACDIPAFYLSLKSSVIDSDIMNLYNIHMYINNNIYMQTLHKQDILFTSFISLSYPHTSVEFLQAVFGENKIIDKLWFNSVNLPKTYSVFSQNSIFVNDFFGLFATFSYKNDMWSFWCENKTELVTKLMNIYQDKVCSLFEVLYALFQLYDRGYEGIRVKKKRLRQIWIDFISITGKEKNIITDTLQHCLAVGQLKLPYPFLLDAYHYNDLNLVEKRIFVSEKNNSYVHNFMNLYTLLKTNTNTIHFCKNIIEKRMLYILLCIYRRFNMFSSSLSTGSQHIVGDVLIEYLRDNILFLV
jgi:hypothetical protein